MDTRAPSLNVVAPALPTPELVGKIYEAAPPTMRVRMLETLLRPLGVLALVGVCNGLFAKIWFRSGWSELQLRPEDVQMVQGFDVAALTDYIQQASARTLDALALLLSSSPLMTCSAAAALLVAELMRRAQAGRTDAGGKDQS